MKINHVLAHKSIRLLFGDNLELLIAAKRRLGTEPIAFLLRKMGTDGEASTQSLAVSWEAELNEPVDYGLIELVVATRDRVLRSPFLIWRLMRCAKKAGLLPTSRLAA